MNNQKQKMELLGNAPISKALLAMGIPTMLGMFINALYNLADAYFVSGLGESQMGAISIVYPLGQIVVGLWLLFGNGAASYISRLLGQGKNEQANKVASTSLYCSWYFTYFRKFNNCYIWLSNSSQTLENAEFVASELTLTLSLMLYSPVGFYEP